MGAVPSAVSVSFVGSRVLVARAEGPRPVREAESGVRGNGCCGRKIGMEGRWAVERAPNMAEWDSCNGCAPILAEQGDSRPCARDLSSPPCFCPP